MKRRRYELLVCVFLFFGLIVCKCQQVDSKLTSRQNDQDVGVSQQTFPGNHKVHSSDGHEEEEEDASALELASFPPDLKLVGAAGQLQPRHLRSLFRGRLSSGERPARSSANSTTKLGQWNAQQPRLLRVQVAALHVDKSEFPLSKLLFKMTLKLALIKAQRYLDEALQQQQPTKLQFNEVRLALSVRSANTCSRQYAAALAAEEFHLKRARLFIVSGCDGAIRAVSWLASQWRVPVMTAAGFGADLNDKRVHKTLVRVAFSLKAAVEFLFKIMKSYQWHRANLLVDESDANSVALRESIERHLEGFCHSTNFNLSLNTQTFDLQSLLAGRFSARTDNNSSRVPGPEAVEAEVSDDKWPNELTAQVIRDTLRQSAGYSRVSVLLMPQQYLRKFMLSVYDQNMANGLYTFISMPLLQLSASAESSMDDSSGESPERAARMTTGKSTGAALNGAAAHSQHANSSKQQSYSASTGENVFVWRSPQARARNAHAKQAFESLMSIYLRTPTTKAYVYFASELSQLANDDYATSMTTTVTPPLGRNSTLNWPAHSGAEINKKVQLNVNPYSASFYDSLQIYARALHESLQHHLQSSLDGARHTSTVSSSSNSTRAHHLLTVHARISDLVRHRRFDNMVTGSVYINANGDRETDYTLDDMNQMTGKFAPVILYRGETRDIERLGRIHWSSDATVGPTSDIVDCALTNTCTSKPITKFTLLLMFLALSLVAILGSVFYIVHNRLSLESQLVDYWWKIHLSEIEFIQTRRKDLKDGSLVMSGGGGGSIIAPSSQGGASSAARAREKRHKMTACSSRTGPGTTIETPASNNHNNYARTEVTRATDTSANWANSAVDVCYGNIELGVFKLGKVALKPISIKFHQSRKLMIELRGIKELNHANLCRFVGILVDEGHLALVSDFCPKGSLREFFQNESMVIDWTFKYSIINDILAGLSYLHSGPLGFHGRLRSSNCLVSARFVVKLSDYGPHSLLDQLDQELADQQPADDWLRKAVWRAPEHMKLSSSRPSGSTKGDIYSFGLLLYEIITNRLPFFSVEKNDYHPRSLRELYQELRQNGPNEQLGLPDMSPIDSHEEIQQLHQDNKGLRPLVELMRACWRSDADKRPTLPDVNSSLKKITKSVTSKKLLENLTSRMEQYTNNLESLVEAKLACLMEEKFKTEELLYQFVPKSIASLLREGQFVEPEAFECVTVFYSDIVGFTSLSSESSPMEVVDFLSDLYLCFDETLEQHDIFKVDTIGDAYIVASGLPQPNEGKHVVEIALAALELRARLKQFKIPHKPERSLEMRVGIHSGPCVAGIVGGLNMPKYCVFGDTLTTGKFMESSGLPMKIHITEDSRRLLAGLKEFHIEARVPRITRDGLPYQTYWLEPGGYISQPQVAIQQEK